MKTIAFFIPDFSIGGVEKTFITYANALVKEYSITFIVLHNSGVLKDDLNSEISIVVLDAKRLRFCLLDLAKALIHGSYDYVVSGTQVTNIYLFLANVLCGNKSKIITSQHNFNDIENSSWIYKYLLPIALRHSFHVFGVSKAITSLLSDMGIDKNKITLLYNPIEIERIEEYSITSVPNLPKNYIVFVGRLYQIKNVPLLLKAFKLFREKYFEYYLVIVGDGNETNRLKKLVHSLLIDDYVLFVGATNNPYPYIRNARVLALSSFVESLSIVTMESLSLGITVVSTPSIGPEEILCSPDYGYVSNSTSDENDFCSTLIYAVEHPISSEKLKKRADFFSINNAINIFKSMLN